MDDRTLVKGLLAGDKAAQGEFDRTYRPRIHRACCYLLGYRDPEAEDVVQETLVAALERLREFEFRSTLYRWLHQIAVYKCYRVIRKRRRLVASLSEEMEGFSQREALERHSAGEAEGKRKEMLEAVRKERDALGEPCRELLRLRGEEGMSYGQLAEALKIPIGTVMSRLSRCLQGLRARLGLKKEDAP